MKRAGQLSPWATHRNCLGIFNTLMPGFYFKDSYLKDLEYAQALGIFQSSQVVPTQPVTHNSSYPLDLEQPQSGVTRKAPHRLLQLSNGFFWG